MKMRWNCLRLIMRFPKSVKPGMFSELCLPIRLQATIYSSGFITDDVDWLIFNTSIFYFFSVFLAGQAGYIFVEHLTDDRWEN